MREAEAETEHLSTVGGLHPDRVLEQFGTEPVVLCVIAVWTRRTMTGHLEEKGVWVRSFWEAALDLMPEAGGCRLLWNSLFIAVPGAGIAQATEQFSQLLQSQPDSCLESRCVLCEAQGTPEHKLDVLDVLQDEVGGDFGVSHNFQPNGYRFYHLRDGKPYVTK